MSTAPFSYYGGKTRLAAQIVKLLPPHGHYVEPFAGSLAVLLAKPRVGMETVNDLDGNLMTFWRVLRDRPDDLARVCALTPHSRGEFHACKDLDTDDELERARRIWVLLSQSRSRTLRVTGWRHYQDPAGSSVGFPRYMAGYVDRMTACAERLAGVSLEARDALDVIGDYGKHPGVLIYADPPYLGSSRNSMGYAVEMAGEGQHRELAAALHGCKATVVLSGYDSPLYADLFDGWHAHRINSWTGNGAAGYGERVEVLWSNVPLTAHLELFGDSA